MMSIKAKFLQVSSVLVANTHEISFRIALSVQANDKTIKTKGLINCGAEGNFLDKDFIFAYRIPTFSFKESIKAKNVNGSIN